MLELFAKSNYLFDLSYLSVLNILGAKSFDFLQGQVSCDIRLIGEKKIQQGALCNLQGRILALFDLVKHTEGYYCILPNNLITIVQQSLAKPAMLMRVLMKENSDLQVFGLYVGNPLLLSPKFKLPEESLEITVSEENYCYNLGDNLYIFIVKKNIVSDFSKPFVESHQLLNAALWHQLQLQHRVVSIYPVTSGLFLPHRLDLHLTGYLNFEKGCYRGQEIIARTHYKAKLKHKLNLFTINSKEKLEAGNKIYDKDKQREIGELIDFCEFGKGKYLIATSIILEYPSQVIIGEQQEPVLLSEYSLS